jgi:hypothetical protein
MTRLLAGEKDELPVHGQRAAQEVDTVESQPERLTLPSPVPAASVIRPRYRGGTAAVSALHCDSGQRHNLPGLLLGQLNPLTGRGRQLPVTYGHLEDRLQEAVDDRHRGRGQSPLLLSADAEVLGPRLNLARPDGPELAAAEGGVGVLLQKRCQPYLQQSPPLPVISPSVMSRPGQPHNQKR